MARQFLTPIDLAQNELQNARVQNLGSAPSSPVKGQIYMNTSDNTLYFWDGTVWVAAKSGAPAAHAASHNAGGGDALAIDAAAGTGSFRTLGYTGTAAMPGIARLDQIATPTADVAWGSRKLTGLADGTNANDAVNRSQLDSVAAGLDPKASVRLATTANHGLTGLTAIDGITPNANDRILVKNQTTTSANGIYVAAAGAWSRATDMDAWTEVPGAFTFVEQGSTQADTGWVSTADTGGTLGTTAIAWTQFSGPGEYVAGAGLTLTGTTFAVGAGTGIVANADDVAVNFIGSGGDNGVATTVARSDHDHDTLYPPVGRTISTTAPLTGGGDLSANRTLAINAYSGGANTGAVPVGGTGTTFLRGDGTWVTPPAGTVSKAVLPCAAATSTVVAHPFATRDVQVEVYRTTTPWDTVECDVERTLTTSITVRFATAPTAGAYQIVVTG